MEIILARHGETEWNVDEVFRGRIDVELNETGTKQAKLLSEYLRGIKIEAIYSSPLKRALRTSEAVAGRHELEVEIAPGLIDFDFGKWQGLSRREVKEKYQELYIKWINEPDKVGMPGGETLNDVRLRAMGVIEEVIVKHLGTVVLVSHRVVNKVLICALLGLDNSHFWNMKQDTCGITIFTCENGRFILTRHNDTSYLKSLPEAPLSDF
ncbi:histidine phosphatase family protein [Chloroflexota bacterium]